jgi:UDP-4-amino-4,6-dideoxy-N-acetyl-beta-L-altrosamine transaminase
MKPIPYGHQDISEADIEAVIAVLRSEWLTQGPAIDHFERTVSEYCGVRYGVAVSSATAALHLACLALDFGPGDLLWTSPNTFVASANCALYCGGHVDFVDIDARTYNMSVEALESKLETARQAQRLPKIVIPVHFAGQPCAMHRIKELSDQYGFRIIEDASHAIGATYRESKIGDCAYSDVTVFSFHPVKIVTTGEGGLLLTNRADLHEKLRRLRSHGITRDAQRMTTPAPGSWYYEQIELGYNYRMTDIQAALGASQMQRLDAFIARRRQIAARYEVQLATLPVTIPWQHPDARSAYHLYVVRVAKAQLRQQVYDALHHAGIRANVHYIPVYRQPYFRNKGFRCSAFPEAERYYAEALTLPIYPALTEGDQSRVLSALQGALA